MNAIRCHRSTSIAPWLNIQSKSNIWIVSIAVRRKMLVLRSSTHFAEQNTQVWQSTTEPSNKAAIALQAKLHCRQWGRATKSVAILTGANANPQWKQVAGTMWATDIIWHVTLITLTNWVSTYRLKVFLLLCMETWRLPLEKTTVPVENKKGPYMQ